MLDIPDLTDRWGKIFGGMNEINTFRGTALVARADTIAALYDTAAEQRNVVGLLYDDTTAASDSLGANILGTYFDLASNTLRQMCIDDPEALAPTATDADCLRKLVSDMLAQAKTYQKPTVTINAAATFANGTSVTTILGAPFGNGLLVGSIIDPKTGVPRLYADAEVLRVVCTTSSYTDGIVAGTETFSVKGEQAVGATAYNWPVGSGTDTTLTLSPSSESSLFSNAYFQSWDATDTNILEDWTTAVLTPGTTITRSTDPYSGIVGEYAVQLTAAPINSDIYQTVNSLVAETNYGIAIRVKRVTTITGGVLTVGLRDSTGTYLTDAAGNDLKFTVALTGAIGDYVLSRSMIALKRGFPTTTILSIKVTTAMVAAETIRLATAEFIPATSAYAGGPDLVGFPGSTGFATQDTNTFTVANSGDQTTFVGNLERLYNISSLGIDVPVASSPTEADSEIS